MLPCFACVHSYEADAVFDKIDVDGIGGCQYKYASFISVATLFVTSTEAFAFNSPPSLDVGNCVRATC